MQGAMSAIAMRSPRSSRPSSDRSSFRGYWAADNGAWVLHGRIQGEFGHVPKSVRPRSGEAWGDADATSYMSVPPPPDVPRQLAASGCHPRSP